MILYGPAGTGKTIARAHHRRGHAGALRGGLGGHRRRRRAAQGDRRRARPARLLGAAHDPVRRRDPPVQQVAAGRAAARGRGPHRRARSARRPRTRSSRSTRRSSAARASSSCTPLSDDDVRAIVRRALDRRARASAATVDARRRTPRTRIVLTRGRRRARRADDARAGGGAGAEPTPTGAARVTLDAVREATPTRILPYDKTRRRALRRHLRVHQVDARQRSRRRGLLARPHDPRRRGPEVHRAPHAHLRLRGRRQRRSRRRCSSLTPRSRPPSRSAGRSAASTSRRRRSTWRSRRRATPRTRRSTPRSTRCATGPARAVPEPPARPPPARRRGVRPVPLPARVPRGAGSSSSTCPTAWSAARSSRRRRGAGRPSGRQRSTRSRATPRATRRPRRRRRAATPCVTALERRLEPRRLCYTDEAVQSRRSEGAWTPLPSCSACFSWSRCVLCGVGDLGARRGGHDAALAADARRRSRRAARAAARQGRHHRRRAQRRAAARRRRSSRGSRRSRDRVETTSRTVQDVANAPVEIVTDIADRVRRAWRAQAAHPRGAAVAAPTRRRRGARAAVADELEQTCRRLEEAIRSAHGTRPDHTHRPGARASTPGPCA